MKIQYKNLNIIGADETGVGDYLTPLVACAAFVPVSNVTKLENLGVTDSKKLTDATIRILAEQIKPLLIHRVTHLTQKGYNKLNESLNANELKMLLHMKAINQVEDKVEKADLIILDQFSTEKSIKKYYEKLGNSSFELKQFKTKMKLVEKGETEHVAVAAASILAREYLLKYMDRQNTKWNTTFPLGTNPIVENFTREFIAEHGKDKLNEIAKVSFKTTQKII